MFLVKIRYLLGFATYGLPAVSTMCTAVLRQRAAHSAGAPLISYSSTIILSKTACVLWFAWAVA